MGHFYNCEIHGLRTPKEAFFIEIQNFGVWADKLGRLIMGHLGYFLPNYQHYFWYSESLVHVFHYSTIILQKTKPLYILDWDLNLGCTELAIYPQSVVQYYIEKPCYMSSLLYLMNIHFILTHCPIWQALISDYSNCTLLVLTKNFILQIMRPF